MMWASLAASGSHGMARHAVWLDLSMAPLGRLILRGSMVGWTFVMGLVIGGSGLLLLHLLWLG